MKVYDVFEKEGKTFGSVINMDAMASIVLERTDEGWKPRWAVVRGQLAEIPSCFSPKLEDTVELEQLASSVESPPPGRTSFTARREES